MPMYEVPVLQISCVAGYVKMYIQVAEWGELLLLLAVVGGGVGCVVASVVTAREVVGGEDGFVVASVVTGSKVVVETHENTPC